MFVFGMGWFMLLGPVALALIAYAIYIAVTRPRSRTTRIQSQNALDILKERYARGEITREQYLKMREELET